MRTARWQGFESQRAQIGPIADRPVLYLGVGMFFFFFNIVVTTRNANTNKWKLSTSTFNRIKYTAHCINSRYLKGNRWHQLQMAALRFSIALHTRVISKVKIEWRIFSLLQESRHYYIRIDFKVCIKFVFKSMKN